MKKIFKFIILFNLFFSMNSFCQPTFTSRYNLPINFAKLIEVAPDGGYYFCGGMNADMVIGKIDSAGNLQWANQIGYLAIQEIPIDIVVLNNGNVVACIRYYDGTNMKAYFISFDLTGNLVFCKRYANAIMVQDNSPYNMIKDGNGFSVALEYDPGNETRIIKADSLGNKTGSAFIGGRLRNIFKTSAGNYLLFAKYSPEIVLFDSSLIYQSSTYTDSDIGVGKYYGMIEISNGSYMLYGDFFGHGMIAKVNSQLELEWQKYYGLTQFGQGKIASAKKIDSNKIAFIGQGETIGNYPYVFKTDTFGNVLDCKLITTGGMNPDDCPGRCAFKNNRFTFMYNLGTGLSFQNITCFKITSVDTTFSLICNAVDSTMIITDDIITGFWNNTYACGPTGDSLVTDSLPIINITFPFGACNDSTLSIYTVTNEANNFKLFPNPFKEILNISTNKRDVSEIILYDITSRNIMQQKFINTISLKTDKLAKGLYLYEIRDKDGLCQKGRVVKD